MRWFGGHSRSGNRPVPVEARLIWPRPAIWVCDAWPERHIQIATSLDESEAVVAIGPCSATSQEVATLVGHHVPDRVITEWAGAYTIIRARPDQVTIWTDPAGACPIYTVRSDDGALVWGSSSRALASLSRAEVDEAWLAAFFADPYAEIAGSAFTGVTPVPPGARLVLADDQVKELTQIWTRTPRRWSEAVDQLRSTLAASVQVRMTGIVAADLSGGMDSTTLAVLAARHRAVNAVTAHPAEVTSGGDLDHARVTASAHPTMRHVLMPLTDDHLPYRGLDTLPATDEPAPSTVTWAMLSAQFELLADIGVTCHLTGDGGDTLFLPPPVYLADLARRGRWLRLAADAQGWARLRRTSPWPLIAQAIRGQSSSTAAAAAPRWLTAHAARLSSASRAEVTMHELPDHADRDLIRRTRYTARTAHTENQLADAFGIAMHNPYLDARLLDITLGVHGWLRGSPRRYKPLLTAATAGLLPETVRNRAAKGTFVGDHHEGLRRNLHHVLDLADGRLAGRGLITLDKLRSEIHMAAAGHNIHWGHLQRVLAAEVWLRSLESAGPIDWAIPTTEVSAA